jgi:hypothetical protein
MEAYAAEIAGKRPRFCGWLSEKARRRDAAVAAAKLGPGGVEDRARVWAGDPKTIRHGLHELEGTAEAAAGRIRTKGGDARRALSRSRPSKRTSATGGRRARPALRGAQACWGRTCRGARGHAVWWRWGHPPSGVRSDGGGANATEAAARRGSTRRWGIIPTATPHVHPWRVSDEWMRRRAMR